MTEKYDRNAAIVRARMKGQKFRTIAGRHKRSIATVAQVFYKIATPAMRRAARRG